MNTKISSHMTIKTFNTQQATSQVQWACCPPLEPKPLSTVLSTSTTKLVTETLVLQPDVKALSTKRTADLEVEVGDALGVKIVDAVQDLLEELCGLLFRQRLLLSQEVKELPAGHQLQDQDHVCLVLKDVVQGDDVAVLNLTQDVDLALDLFAADPPPAGRQPALLDELGSILHP